MLLVMLLGIPILRRRKPVRVGYRILLHIRRSDARDRKIRLDRRNISRYPNHARHVLSKYETGGNTMKTWTKPAVREQEVGLEVTSYLPAEIDVI
jgi:coenzyme PQQ precursor peptide PqqA